MAEGKFVTYYRVSTKRQEQSGLGLDAQKETVARYLKGGGWTVISEYVEAESGKKDDRPELQKAIRDCQLKNAKLVVAKLDRLSRDLHFISSLQKAGIQFIIAEMPECTELTVHIYAAMAEHERKMISARTKAALQQVKKRGVLLGNPCVRQGQRVPGSGDTTHARAARIATARAWRAQMRAVVADITSNENQSLRKIADELNNRGFETPLGKQFTAAAVQRIIK